MKAAPNVVWMFMSTILEKRKERPRREGKKEGNGCFGSWWGAKKDGPPQTTFHFGAALRCRQLASGKEVGEGGLDVVGNISTGWAAIDASHGYSSSFLTRTTLQFSCRALIGTQPHGQKKKIKSDLFLTVGRHDAPPSRPGAREQQTWILTTEASRAIIATDGRHRTDTYLFQHSWSALTAHRIHSRPEKPEQQQSGFLRRVSRRSPYNRNPPPGVRGTEGASELSERCSIQISPGLSPGG